MYMVIFCDNYYKIKSVHHYVFNNSCDLDHLTVIGILLIGPGMFANRKNPKFSFFSNFRKNTLFWQCNELNLYVIFDVSFMKYG